MNWKRGQIYLIPSRNSTGKKIPTIALNGRLNSAVFLKFSLTPHVRWLFKNHCPALLPPLVCAVAFLKHKKNHRDSKTDIPKIDKRDPEPYSIIK